MTIISSCQSTDSTNPKPIQFNPIQSNPILSHQIQSNSILSHPIQSNSFLSIPTLSYLILSNLIIFLPPSFSTSSSTSGRMEIYLSKSSLCQNFKHDFYFILLIHNMLEKNNMLPCLILCGFISIFHLRHLPLYLL